MSCRGRHLCASACVVLLLVSCRPHAPRLADPRSPEEKSWDAAHAAEDAENLENAKSAYLLLCRKTPPYIRGCFDYARMMFKTAPPSEARSIAVQTIVRFPNESFTLSLIKRLAHSYLKDQDAASGVTDLGALEKQVRKSEVRDSVLYEIAALSRTLGDTAGETKSLEILAAEHSRWKSQLWDDAVWRLSNICRQENRTADEIKWLNILLAERESSRLIGSYTSPFHDDALYRLGEIHLTAKRFDDAYRVFMELAAMSASRMNDDGMLGAAQAEIGRGRIKEACGLLKRVVKNDGSAITTAKKTAALVHCPNY